MSTAVSTCGLCSALLLAASAHAGIVRNWSLEELAKSEVLAVARVEFATPSAKPVRQVGDRVPVHSCTAELTVLRSFGKIGDSVPLRYECYSGHGPGVSGYPIFPVLEAGQVRVFPLKRAGESWVLLGDDGIGLLMPALPNTGNLAGTALAYLVDELANSFLHGTYKQMFEAAQYCVWMPPKLLIERIETDLPDGDARWLDIASVSLATMGIPRPALAELKGFAGRALSHVPESRRRSGIVRNMLRHMDVHLWGTAATLVPEFKNDPLLLELLPGYLTKLTPGSLNVAWWLARNGQETLIPISLDTATRTLEQPKVEVNDIYAATNLLVKHGSDMQFAKLLDALNASRNTDRYMQLWQVAYGEEGPRILQLIAVLLEDERPMSANTTMRYCDIAGGRLQMLAKTDFGFKQWNQDISERRAAVQRARKWLRDSMRK